MALYLYKLLLENFNEIDIQRCLPKLPNSLQKKVLQCRFLEEKYRMIFSNLFLRKILAREMKKDFRNLEIQFSKYGKPFLINQDRHFNLSHSKQFIVLVTDDFPVGIDIEYVRPIKDLHLLMELFSKEEQKEFFAKDKDKQEEYFYELWTLKESYIKALGEGLNHSLNSFNINISEKKISLMDNERIWYFYRYFINSHYKCSVCARHDQFPVNVINIHAEELIYN